jgi:hypothetical protein
MELNTQTSTESKLYGNYRAKVVDNKDPLKCGRVMVWIPDIMVSVSEDFGLWARPANNPVGGRNLEGDPEHHYMGSCYIPKKGAWVWIFFEAGNMNRPYYFGALDLENTQVLPENQLGQNYEDKWTIFKSHEGRTIIISDDPSDARVEITGKKENLSDGPTGSTGSVYTIDGNQNTILLDERSGKEKILIRTKSGDFLHIDIGNRKLQAYFASDIVIRTDGKIQMTSNGNIDILAGAGDIKMKANSGKIQAYAADEVRISSGADFSAVANKDAKITATGSVHHLAGRNVNNDAGGNVNDQCGQAVAGQVAQGADVANPQGGRDT